MLFTGSNDFGKYEAKNFNLEEVAVLPVFQSNDFRRVLYVTTSGTNFGVWVGGVSGWERFTSSSAGTASSISENMKFAYWQVEKNLNKDIYPEAGGEPGERAVRSGFIIAAAVAMRYPTTGGSIVVVPTINGMAIVDNRLNLLIDSSNPQHQERTVVQDVNFGVVSGDLVGMRLMSDNALTPEPIDLKSKLSLIYLI